MKHFILILSAVLFSIHPLFAEEGEIPNKLQLQLPASITVGGWHNSLSSAYIQSHIQKKSTSWDFIKPKVRPGVKPYKFMDEMTFVGIPLFAAGWIIKSEKAAFQQNAYRATVNRNTHLLTEFGTPIDDFTQYFGMVMPVALKLGGVEGRSDWLRLGTNIATSWAIMGIMVNGIKYTASEMRPDGSKANSWPSGHTATAFLGATWLHKEYGLTRSPWYSVAGYSVATATGVMRVLNNRHWVSDILSGAGIGILSGELGYAITDLIFKEKGLLRNDKPFEVAKPSFFSVSMGVGLGSHQLEFTPDDLKDSGDMDDWDPTDRLSVSFRSATTVDAEGAYFFNKYVGVGGRLRLRAMSARDWSDFSELTMKHNIQMGYDLINLYKISASDLTEEEMQAREQLMRERTSDLVKTREISIVTDHLTEFSANLGLYFNVPLSKRFALGSKLLIGRSITQELDLDAHMTGNMKATDYKMTIENGNITSLDVSNFRNLEKDYDITWDLLTLGGNRSTTYGTGLSLTYYHKSNFSMRIFADYDYTNKKYTLKYDPYRFLKEAAPTLEKLFINVGTNMNPYEFERKHEMHFVTLGGSFVVNF